MESAAPSLNIDMFSNLEVTGSRDMFGSAGMSVPAFSFDLSTSTAKSKIYSSNERRRG
jgi:hypothetical protein